MITKIKMNRDGQLRSLSYEDLEDGDFVLVDFNGREEVFRLVSQSAFATAQEVQLIPISVKDENDTYVIFAEFDEMESKFPKLLAVIEKIDISYKI